VGIYLDKFGLVAKGGSFSGATITLGGAAGGSLTALTSAGAPGVSIAGGFLTASQGLTAKSLVANQDIGAAGGNFNVDGTTGSVTTLGGVAATGACSFYGAVGIGSLGLGSGMTTTLNMNGNAISGVASVTATGAVHGNQLFADQYNDGVTVTTATIGASGQVVRTPSTRRAKKNIRNLKPDPAAVLRLRPVTFQYRDAESFGKTRRPGLIAEELLELGLDEYVVIDADGSPAGIHYAELVTAVIPVLQDLTARIEQLEAGRG
jgi:hypothetical protein